jgi:hypothetical protein
MMCHDELPEDSWSLTGDYFSRKFTYLQVTLIPCKNKKEGTCATQEEMAAFYEANPKL